MRRHLLGSLFALAVTLPTSASAKSLHDDATSFALELHAEPGDLVCIRLPEREADNTPECDLPPGAPYSGMRGERSIGGAIVRRGDWAFSIAATVNETKGIGEVSAESVRAIAEDVARSVRAHGVSVVPTAAGAPLAWELVRVASVDGIRVTVDLLVEGGGVVRLIAYFLYHQDRSHNVIVASPREHAAEVEAYAQRMLATMKIPPGDARLFGKPRWLRDAHWIAVHRALPFAMGTAVLATGTALFAWRRRRGRAETRGRRA